MNKIKEQLYDTLGKIETAEDTSEKESLGYEALANIEDILQQDPNDTEVIELRMQLNNDWVFSNTSAMIADAEFLSKNEELGKNRNTGYDWLSWIYNEKLGMPDTAYEILAEQYTEIPKYYDKHYEVKEKQSAVLNHMYVIKKQQGLFQEALTLGMRSFDFFPFIHHRNDILGRDLLQDGQFEKACEVLYLHFYWSMGTGDTGLRIEYAKEIAALYKTGQLKEYPELIALYFHVVRNEKAAFGLSGKMDFYNKYSEELEASLKLYPRCSNLWTVMANTWYCDVENYSKALQYYRQMLLGDDPFCNNYHERILDCCNQLGEDFFSLPFSYESGQAEIHYNTLTSCYGFWQETKDKRFLEMAVKYGKNSYGQYREFLYNEAGSSYNNQPHMFAMCCNNYGLALSFINEGQKDWQLYKAQNTQIAKIHWEGYQVSPFMENIDNAIYTAKCAGAYEDLGLYAQIKARDFGNEFTAEDSQLNNYMAMLSLKGANDVARAKALYEKSKEEYINFDDRAQQITRWFMYCAIYYYMLLVEDNEMYEDALPELDWFIANNHFTTVEKREVGRASYLKALCLVNMGRAEEGKQFALQAVDLLTNAGEAFYEEYLKQAKKLNDKLNAIPDYEEELKNLCEGNWTVIEKKSLLDNEDDKIAFLDKLIDTFSNSSMDTIAHWTDDNRCFEIFRNRIEDENYRYNYVRFYFADTERAYNYFSCLTDKLKGGLFSKKQKITQKSFSATCKDFKTGETTELNGIAANEMQQQGNELWNELHNRFLKYEKQGAAP